MDKSRQHTEQQAELRGPQHRPQTLHGMLLILKPPLQIMRQHSKQILQDMPMTPSSLPQWQTLRRKKESEKTLIFLHKLFHTSKMKQQNL